MVKMQKIEDEAKAIAAETESVASGILSAITPRWDRFVASWKGWSTRKKLIAAAVIAATLVFAIEFGVDVSRLMVGGYRSAYAYGHGYQLTKSDMDAALKASNANEAELSDLRQTVHQIQIELQAVEERLSKPVVTGSIKRRHK